MNTNASSGALYERVRKILESARTGVARTVNTTQVIANWLIGRKIVEEEQHGKRRAGYGENLLAGLSARLTEGYGKGFTVRNLEFCRNFYFAYPGLLAKSNAVRSISSNVATPEISNALRSEFKIGPAMSSQSWRPGQLHPIFSTTVRGFHLLRFIRGRCFQ